MTINFSRQVLPAGAVIAIIIALYLVLGSQPDRALAEPVTTPPTAPAQAGAGGAAGSRGAASTVVAGSGVVEPSSELIEIGAQLPGVIDRVYVEPGQQVSVGAPLFSIDSRAARAAISEAQARIVRLRETRTAATTSLTVARQQLALYRGVSDPRAVSRQEVIQREGIVADAAAQVGVADASINEARAQLQSAQVALSRLTVRAPQSATVLQVSARAGEYAAAGPAGGGNASPLLTMGVTMPLHVRIDIDENEIERIGLGRAAVITPRGGATRRVTASFVRAEPLMVPKRSLTNSSTERVDVRVLQLIFALPPGTEGFFVGQQVDAFVPAATRTTATRTTATPTATPTATLTATTTATATAQQRAPGAR